MSLFFYLFTFVINLWYRKFITADVTAMFLNNQHDIQWRDQNFDKNTEIHSEYTVTRIEELKSVYWKCNVFAFFPCALNICRKFEFLISQGSVGTCLRWGGWCRMRFLAIFTRLPEMQKFWKSVKIWQSYKEFKGGNFFETQCRSNSAAQPSFLVYPFLSRLSACLSILFEL